MAATFLLVLTRRQGNRLLDLDHRTRELGRYVLRHLLVLGGGLPPFGEHGSLQLQKPLGAVDEPARLRRHFGGDPDAGIPGGNQAVLAELVQCRVEFAARDDHPFLAVGLQKLGKGVVRVLQVVPRRGEAHEFLGDVAGRAAGGRKLPGRCLLTLLDGDVKLGQLPRDLLEFPLHREVGLARPFLGLEARLGGGEHLGGEALQPLHFAAGAVPPLPSLEDRQFAAHLVQIGEGPLARAAGGGQGVHVRGEGHLGEVCGMLLQRALHLYGLQLKRGGALGKDEELPLNEFHPQKAHPADDGDTGEGEQGVTDKLGLYRHVKAPFLCLKA